MILWTDDIPTIQRVAADLDMRTAQSAMPDANARADVLAWCRLTGCQFTMLRILWIPGDRPKDGYLRMQMGFRDEDSALAFKMRWL